MTDYHLTTLWQQSRGVIGRYPDEGDRYIFEFDTAKQRGVHMVGVRKPLRVTWLVDGEVMEQTVLQPWVGHGTAPADTIVEERP